LSDVRAGSALLRLGDRLLAIQDDAWSVAWILLPDLSVRMQVLEGDGLALPKDRKPDFEAALAGPDGVIHVLGSGSLPNRCVVARIDTENSAVAMREMPALYTSIAQALGLSGRPNIEAAVTLGDDRCRLFHRGVGAEHSASVDLHRSALDGDPPFMLAHQHYELGQLEGVALHITDAQRIDRARIAFLAVAEQADDAITDGPVAGSIIGLIEDHATSGRVRWTRLMAPDGQPSLCKPEGLVMDEDRRGAWILTDPDSAVVPAELCRVELGGFS
jgi:hypothetical protein